MSVRKGFHVHLASFRFLEFQAVLIFDAHAVPQRL